MTANPFRPAEQVAPKVKALLYGTSGIGKTYCALTAPGKVAVIDTEGGTAFYANRVGKGLSEFDVLPTKTFAQVEAAIAYLKANPDAYETLVIDPVTVLYETLQDAALRYRTDKSAQKARARQEAFDPDNVDLEQLDWGRIKRSYKRLMTDLVNLPVHVVVIAREADLTEERMENGRKQRVKIGAKPDAEKSTPYYFDTVIRLVPSPKGRDAVVEKDRTGSLELGSRITNPTFDALFGKAIAAGGTGTRTLASDEDAARTDATMTIGAEVAADRDEQLTSLGELTRSGLVVKGDGMRSNLEPRETPDGYMFGFRLHVGDGKAIPQVVAEGAFGRELFEALGEDVSLLLDQRVTVTGELFEVYVPGRRKYHRLVISSLATDKWTVPAPTDTATPTPPEAAGASPAPKGPSPDDAPAATANPSQPFSSSELDEALASVGGFFPPEAAA